MGSYGKVTQGSSSVPTLITLQNEATATGNGTAMDVTGYATAILQVSSTGVATILFEASVDGTNYYPIYGQARSTTLAAFDSFPVLKTSAFHFGDHADPTLWSFNVAGFSSLRARISGYSNGSITVKGSRSVLTHPNLAPILASRVFTACNPKYTVPATPTEMITLYGTTDSIIRVLRIELMTEQTTAGTNDIYLYSRSTAASGGTPVSVTHVAHTSGISPGASMKYYTANPTPGTSAGKILDGWSISAPGAGRHIEPAWKEVFRAQNDDEAIVLSASGEGLAFNFNGAALPAGFKIQARFTWKEEVA